MHFKLFTLLVFWGLLIVWGKQNNKKMWYTKIKLEHNPHYLQNFVAKLSADRVGFNLDAHVLRDLTDDLWLQVLLSSWQQSASSYRSRLKHELNVYDLLRTGMKDKSSLLFIWLDTFWKSGNLSMDVPFRQGIYHWHDVRSAKDSIPPYVFQGTYRFDVITYFKLKKSNEQREMLMNMTLYFKIKPY